MWVSLGAAAVIGWIAGLLATAGEDGLRISGDNAADFFSALSQALAALLGLLLAALVLEIEGADARMRDGLALFRSAVAGLKDQIHPVLSSTERRTEAESCRRSLRFMDAVYGIDLRHRSLTRAQQRRKISCLCASWTRIVARYERAGLAFRGFPDEAKNVGDGSDPRYALLQIDEAVSELQQAWRQHTMILITLVAGRSIGAILALSLIMLVAFSGDAAVPQAPLLTSIAAFAVTFLLLWSTFKIGQLTAMAVMAYRRTDHEFWDPDVVSSVELHLK
jgi:hypothetical protein